MDKLPSGHCGFKSAASLSSGAEFLMGGEAMVDGSEVGSGAPLIITKGVHQCSLVQKNFTKTDQDHKTSIIIRPWLMA